MEDDKKVPAKIEIPSRGRWRRLHPDDRNLRLSYLEWADSGFLPRRNQVFGNASLYGSRFTVVELNYTWYQMARADSLARMAAAAPGHMRFAAKLTRTMTHERDRDWRTQVRLYREGIAPLKEKLLAILVQLPPGF